MTTSLVYQLQAEAIDDSSSISGLLMKAKLVASKLGLEDLTEWIEFELGGYPSRAEVPPYRRFSNQPQAFNPYVGWIPISFGDTPDNLLYEFTTIYVQESIANVEKHVADSGRLEIRMPEMLREMLYAGSTAPANFKVSWRFSAVSLSSILSTVRGRILNWSLDLEKQGILGEGVTFSLRERELAGMVFKNDFNGAVINNNGVLGSSTGDVAQENTMSIGSFDELRNELKKIGVTDGEVDELHEAIDSSEQPLTSTGFSPKISEWVGKVSVKAMQGGLKVGGAVAVGLLAKLITAYLGS
ncbi:hypothetical protein ABUL17_07590 [Enterobacter hormaechei]|uniref:AbiTii domain-containing protein n=1 Tax=Enterobacter cloacae complex TaxID=354276 RepID=UPI000F82231E|nr:hypothetical protein [Enterobacter hormaechei]RTN72290.1 hypothetical protein EKN88_04670 [Enterobacter hormaechei]